MRQSGRRPFAAAAVDGDGERVFPPDGPEQPVRARHRLQRRDTQQQAERWSEKKFPHMSLSAMQGVVDSRGNCLMDTVMNHIWELRPIATGSPVKFRCSAAFWKAVAKQFPVLRQP